MVETIRVPQGTTTIVNQNRGARGKAAGKAAWFAIPCQTGRGGYVSNRMNPQRLPFHVVAVSACLLGPCVAAPDPPSIERLDPALEALVAPGTAVRDLGGTFRWAEGPVWDKAHDQLLFSDVPGNVVHAWNPDKGYRVFLKPSGCTSPNPAAREPGSNGLAFDAKGNLLLCEHGDRRVSRYVAGQGKTTLADRHQGKRLNSPNDLTVHSSGAIYFTDPVYGLPQGENDPARELDFCGVFRIAPDGKLDLLTKELERPNGIALAPDEKTLYVANSHGPRPVVMAYPVAPDGLIGPGRVFFHVGGLKGKGAPDGLKVDAKGNLWATGPGGLLILSPEGKLLGRVLAGRAVANVAFGGADGKDVFLTASDRLLVFRRL